MQDTLELQPIDAADPNEPATQRTDVAVAAAGAIDLKKIDLTAVALAQFGDWRAATAKLKADNTKTVLDLSTQSKIDDAISLRQRTVKQPLADARKVEKVLKSKLSETSKAVAAELVLLEAAYADASTPITMQIDTAQAKIDAAKEAIRQAEIARLAALREAVTEALAAWAERCREDGITAERIGRGVAMLEQLEPDAAWAEVDAYWQSSKAQTLATMRGLQAAAQQREDAARIEAQRQENERIAAENARIAAEAAAESARVAAAAAAEKAAAEALMEQARKMLAAAEAKRPAGELAAQQAADDRLMATAFSAANKRAGRGAAMAVYDNFLGEDGRVPHDQVSQYIAALDALTTPAANVATAAAAEGTAETPEPGTLKAAPITQDALVNVDSCILASGADELAPQSLNYAPAGTSSAAAASVAGLTHLIGIEPSGIELPMPTHAANIPAGLLPDVVRDRALDLQALAAEARASRFPRQPKMTPEWWAALYSAVDSLAAEVA